MLIVKDLSVFYGHIHALKGVSVEVEDGSVVALIGSNGAGKSTLLNTISGLVKPKSGSIEFDGRDITREKPENIVKMGIVQCPEGRKIFGNLTVYDNLMAGALSLKDVKGIKNHAEELMTLFPRLAERRKQLGSTLSGGEQQMLAICRALMANPKILLLDEPSMGLSPTMVKEVFDTIRKTSDLGVTIMLVEQNANMALKLSKRAYVIESGVIVQSGDSSELLRSDEVRKAYLGEE